MSLDIMFNAQSRLDPRYSRAICWFGNVDFLLTYFNVCDEDNCKPIEISGETLHGLLADIRSELSSHAGTYLPKKWEDVDKGIVVEPHCERLLSRIGKYDYFYWGDMRHVYRKLSDVLKNGEVDLNLDTVTVTFWW